MNKNKLNKNKRYYREKKIYKANINFNKSTLGMTYDMKFGDSLKNRQKKMIIINID